MNEYRELKRKIEPLTEAFEQPDFQNASRAMRTSAQLLEYLQSRHGISESIIDDVYNYAKFNYDIGNYEDAYEQLGKFTQLAPTTHPHALDAIWGRLASAICSEQFDSANDAMTQVRIYSYFQYITIHVNFTIHFFKFRI